MCDVVVIRFLKGGGRDKDSVIALHALSRNAHGIGEVLCGGELHRALENGVRSHGTISH